MPMLLRVITIIVGLYVVLRSESIAVGVEQYWRDVYPLRLSVLDIRRLLLFIGTVMVFMPLLNLVRILR